MDQNSLNSLTSVNAVKTETHSVSDLDLEASAHKSGGTAELMMQTPPSQNVVDKGLANPDADARPVSPRPTATKNVSHLPGDTTAARKIVAMEDANTQSNSLRTSSAVVKEKSMLPPPPVQKASEKTSPSRERLMPPPPRIPESSQTMTKKVLLPLPRKNSESVDLSASAKATDTGHMPPPPPRQAVAPSATSDARPFLFLPIQSIHDLRPLPSPSPEPWKAFGWQRVPSKSKANSFSYLHVKTGLRQKKVPTGEPSAQAVKKYRRSLKRKRRAEKPLLQHQPSKNWHMFLKKKDKKRKKDTER